MGSFIFRPSGVYEMFVQGILSVPVIQFCRFLPFILWRYSESELSSAAL